MPAISTLLYPAPAYTRVEVNWADVGWATGAAVYRVDCLTGERTPLRPYVCFDGDFLTLSCGYGIFWDTEAQLDRCVYYCTQAIDAAGDLVTQPAALIAADSYTRVLVDSWGTVESGLIAGQAYVLSGGTVPGDYDVNGTRATQTVTDTGNFRRSILTPTTSNYGMSAELTVPVLPTGASLSAELNARFTDANNNYRCQVLISTAGVVTVNLARTAGGAFAILATTVASGTHAAGMTWTLKLEVWGSQIRCKVWRTTDPEPDWMLSVTDSSVPTANPFTLNTRREGGNTNGTVVFAWDNLYVYDPCADLETMETCSNDLVVPSSGSFRLGDPVRPCNDVTLLFDAPIDPNCVPTQGIFFGNMADEEFPAVTGAFLPVNARYPIVVNRARQAVTSQLTVASKTFADRDALRTLNVPGSPLLLRGPAEHGIDDRYMSVGNMVETRPVSDHRVQPRVVTLPHGEVARPSGPTTGVCGARVRDLCDIYPTWDALIAAGLTYADLLRGRASTDTPIPDTVERDWDEVNSDYASWAALNAGEVDWDETLAGD